MSQAGRLNSVSATPGDVATAYVTDAGTAVPAVNILNVLGGTDITTSGSGNTITITNTGGAGITLTGDTGGPLTGSSFTIQAKNNNVFNNCGSTVLVAGSGTTLTLNVTDSNNNTTIGYDAGGNLRLNPSLGSANTALGIFALSIVGGNNSGNTAIGYNSLTLIGTNAGFNTAIGSSSLASMSGAGSFNIAIGNLAGSSYSSTESSNILIGSSGGGGESHVIRIGSQGTGNQEQNACYIAGINNVNSSGFTSPLAVFVDSANGQLGYGSGGGGSVTIAGDSGSISGSSLTIFTDLLHTNCGTTVSFVNSGTTSTFNVTDAQSNTVIGNSSGVILAGFNNVVLGASSAQSFSTDTNNVLIGNSVGTLLSGSTNNTLIGYQVGSNYVSTESNNVLIGSGVRGASAESNVIRIADSTSLTPATTCYIGGINTQSSAGFTSPAPVFVDSVTGQLGFGSSGGSGITTINVDNGGSVTGSTVDLFANSGTALAGSTVNFIAASGTEIDLQVSDNAGNTVIGNGAGSAALSSTGAFNTILGVTAGQILASNSNTIIGWNAGFDFNGGGNCTIIGANAGNTYTGSEANNVLIGYLVGGPAGESNVTRIADASGGGGATTCYIGGISGVTVTGTAVLCSTSGQLGTIASSRIYKENIQSIEESSILSLRPVKFNYISDKIKSMVYGLIAEEVAQVFPDLVFYRDGAIDSVKYHEMPALLLNEIQKLNKRIEILESK